MRAGRLTSSKLGTVMANLGKAFGEPAKKYAVDIAIEQIGNFGGTGYGVVGSKHTLPDGYGRRNLSPVPKCCST